MKEDIQIEQAARLADVKAPEDINTERSRSFVASTLGERSCEKKSSILFRFFSERPLFAWGGSAFALAVAAVAIVLVIPIGRHSTQGVQVYEMTSIHASSDVVDSTEVASSDSLDTFELPTIE